MNITDNTFSYQKIYFFGNKSATTTLVLQLQNLRVNQVRELYIRVNTRELNKELCTRWSILYTNYS